MLLTYKIKHNRDFLEELRKARKVAEFCIKYKSQNRSFDSLSKSDSSELNSVPAPGDVKHIGLKSAISNQIIRKYSQKQDLRSAKNVKLIIPSRAVNVDRDERTLLIPCLKLTLDYHFSNNFKKYLR